ncbi:Glyoxylase, beta-lactamase superfamily II [Burkholderia sp. OK233]|nr:Glyoxylase, beta-lactamase superfamily II [Burkholderia sp. OK233]
MNLVEEKRSNPMTYRFPVGDVDITVIAESVAPLLRWQEIYPAATADAVHNSRYASLPDLFDGNTERFVIAIQAFLVRADGLNILVDTCVGDCKDRVRDEFRLVNHWLDRLNRTGVTADHIDRVVTTHIHVDHVGWNTRLRGGLWIPTFPNARYLFVDAELAFWRGESSLSALQRTGDYVADSIDPVVEAGLADIVQPDHAVSPSVSLVHLPGHTPGHVGVSIESGGQKAILTGDLLHTPWQCENPHWNTRFCVDPQQSHKTRESFMAQYVDSSVMLVPSHFPYPCAGYLRSERTGFSFEFIDESLTISMLS